MASRTEFRIEGARELERVLRQLPKKIGRRVLASAVRSAAEIVRREAAARAPVRAEAGLKRISKGKAATRAPGFLKANIIKKTLRGSSEAHAAVMVGPRREAYYGWIVEFGDSRNVPRPFLRPAFDAKVGEAINKMGTQLGKNIERAAKRLAGPLAKSGLVRRRRRR